MSFINLLLFSIFLMFVLWSFIILLLSILALLPFSLLTFSLSILPLLLSPISFTSFSLPLLFFASSHYPFHCLSFGDNLAICTTCCSGLPGWCAWLHYILCQRANRLDLSCSAMLCILNRDMYLLPSSHLTVSILVAVNLSNWIALVVNFMWPLLTFVNTFV